MACSGSKPLNYLFSDFLALRQSLCPSYYLQDFLGDGGLTAAIVGKFERLEELTGIFGGLFHGAHAGTLLRGIRL